MTITGVTSSRPAVNKVAHRWQHWPVSSKCKLVQYCASVQMISENYPIHYFTSDFISVQIFMH